MDRTLHRWTCAVPIPSLAPHSGAQGRVRVRGQTPFDILLLVAVLVPVLVELEFMQDRHVRLGLRAARGV